MLDRFKVPDDIAVRIAPDDMRATVENMFRALGMPETDAAQAADVLIYADVRGIESHGVSNMMRAYVHWLRTDRINPAPDWKIVRDTGPALNVDSDNGLGLVVGPAVMDLVIERAKQYGIAFAVTTNSGHYGAAAYHAHRALDHDMIGMSMTSGGVQVAPTFGAEPLLGLNPIGIAAPAGAEVPFLFDASMSSVAGNKIGLLRRVGGNVMPGWVAEENGAPVMEEAPVPPNFLLLPLGGTREIGSHKGFGLMMMVEALTTVLAGSGAGPDRRTAFAHSFLACDVAAFTDLDTFKADMDAYLKRLRECRTAPGEERVVYPGMPEAEDEADRSANGIPYHPEVIDWFTTTCAELGVTHRLD
ncbi:MAG: Ldh family oxidoreductase [Gammaproteobacteria bacterium]|nr:Ldh family oxidoreductase [Gammaproteobacteria bacterium]